MTLGLRRGELAGLRWEDIRFEELTVMAQRSVVDQVVGKVKTEASKRPIPIDPFREPLGAQAKPKAERS